MSLLFFENLNTVNFRWKIALSVGCHQKSYRKQVQNDLIIDSHRGKHETSLHTLKVYHIHVEANWT